MTRLRPDWRVAARFACVGVANTSIDVVLFLLLHDKVGVLGANLVSTTAGMTFSFVANGLCTFGAGRLTLRQAQRFLATTGVTMWIVQPLAIYGLLDVVGDAAVAKLLAVPVCFGLNFAAYRLVVWPDISPRRHPARALSHAQGQ